MRVYACVCVRVCMRVCAYVCVRVYVCICVCVIRQQLLDLYLVSFANILVVSVSLPHPPRPSHMP